MEYRQLGHSGLKVSKLVMGTLTLGGRAGFEQAGNIDATQARRMLDIALDHGVNLVDTANMYSMGLAEEVLGKALQGKRDEILLASKVRTPMGEGPNDGGASRYHIIRECENSLRRLNTDHLDLYQLHQWDGETPIEESLAALDHLVQSGKVRYVGTSNYNGWQMMKAMATAREHHLVRPISQQVYYTPESREAEYEILPVGRDQGLGTLIWSPLGEGLLSGQVRRDKQVSSDHRQGTDWPEPYVHDWERAYDIIDTLVEVGDGHGVSAARVALAWLNDRPGVTSLIVGARNEDHLKDNLASLELKLSEEEINRIEEVTRPVPIYPYWHRAMNGTDRPEPADEPFMEGFRKTMGL
ncbi:aryl-alcohol dehydrogenase-like predicted oxidoreductase [Modicisalibacter xianhensis]|uniref:Aryl-alcohol dehydrogenase-like predicted oxidoreductase n=1 Tax=Modicisalibacter xianhensis TaxID=442341 RepID=A0A4R8G055_9GAMM|nr:aldo/keto reductase [Halomonas xianhensis]TDX32789.1 aryl-alcohol dehydrogenase-like predicted oxidoreductase [Halomonas xianhensis]